MGEVLGEAPSSSAIIYQVTILEPEGCGEGDCARGAVLRPGLRLRSMGFFCSILDFRGRGGISCLSAPHSLSLANEPRLSDF